MEIEKYAQEPGLEPTLHKLAKPVTKAAAWAMLATGFAALAAAGWRTARG